MAQADDPAERTARLFFALWPDEAQRRQLREQPSPRGRLVPPQNWHITLLFLGAVEPQGQKAIEHAADHVHSAPFELTLDLRGHWRRAGVTWLSASRVPPALESLHAQLKAAAQAQGLPVEQRPFVPHLTLARRAAPEATQAIAPITWPVNEFCLVESTTLPSGAQYRVRRRWPLSAADAAPFVLDD